MKYEYGVEYATGFNCPSLPGDVMVEARYSDGNWHRDGADRLDEFNWASFSHFRIVDERYKPNPEDNTWFERGELPPVGVECEAKHENLRDGEWFSVEILKHRVNDTGTKVAATMSVDDRHLHWLSKFRPIRTDREKAIEAAKAALLKKGSLAIITNLETLYDAGLLRLPEGK